MTSTARSRADCLKPHTTGALKFTTNPHPVGRSRSCGLSIGGERISAARELGLIHRGVRAVQQLLGAEFRGTKHDADADTDRHELSSNQDRLCDGRNQPVRSVQSVLLRRTWKKDREFIASEPGDDVARPQ